MTEIILQKVIRKNTMKKKITHVKYVPTRSQRVNDNIQITLLS